MPKFKVPEIFLGLLIGIALSLFFGAIGSYQASHCYEHQGGIAAKPAEQKQAPVAAPQEGGGGHEKPAKHGKSEPMICGIAGLLPALVSYMDSHEGFFVGMFTGLLFIATIFLWLSTRGLIEAGEGQRQSSERIADRQRRSSERIAMFARMQTQSAIAAARRSAEAAKQSADISAQVFRHLERPYLFVNIVETRRLRSPDPVEQPSLDYEIFNYGKLPAILRSVAISLENNPRLPLLSPSALAEKTYAVIAPGRTWTPMRTIAVAESKPDERFQGAKATGLIFHGLIQYEDPTGAFHSDSFCMRGMWDSDGFTIEGGEEYNRHETEYPPPRPPRMQGDPRT